MAFATIGVAGTAALVSAAAATASVGMGIAQAASSKKNLRQRELEALSKQSPLAKPSKSVNDYYQQALNRFSENPYQSQEYLRGKSDINQMIAQNMQSLQDRRAGIGGVSKLAAAKTGALRNLAGQIYGQKAQQFNQLGQATQMKKAEEDRLYQLNEKNPYDTQLALKQMQAQAAAEQNAAGWQTAANGLSNLGAAAASGVFKGMGGKTNIDTSVTTPGGWGANTGNYGAGATDFSKYGLPKPIQYKPFKAKIS